MRVLVEKVPETFNIPNSHSKRTFLGEDADSHAFLSTYAHRGIQ